MRSLATCPAARNREPVCQQPSGHPAMRRGLALLPPRRDESPLAKSHSANRLPHQEPALFGPAFKGCTGVGDLPARVMEAGNLPNAKEVTFA
jgi:hypothetical protein